MKRRKQSQMNADYADYVEHMIAAEDNLAKLQRFEGPFSDKPLDKLMKQANEGVDKITKKMGPMTVTLQQRVALATHRMADLGQILWTVANELEALKEMLEVLMAAVAGLDQVTDSLRSAVVERKMEET